MKQRNVIIVSAISILCVALVVMAGLVPHRDNIPEKILMSASWSYNYSDLKELTESSDLIARISVMDDGFSTDVDGIPMTYYTAAVTIPIDGCSMNDTITIAMTGGPKENFLYEIADDPLMKESDDFLVFCRKNTTGTYTVLSGSQGRMTINNGLVSSLNVSNDQVQTYNLGSNINVQNIPLEEFILEVSTYLKSNS